MSFFSSFVATLTIVDVTEILLCYTMRCWEKFKVDRISEWKRCRHFHCVNAPQALRSAVRNDNSSWNSICSIDHSEHCQVEQSLVRYTSTNYAKRCLLSAHAQYRLNDVSGVLSSWLIGGGHRRWCSKGWSCLQRISHHSLLWFIDEDPAHTKQGIMFVYSKTAEMWANIAMATPFWFYVRSVMTFVLFSWMMAQSPYKTFHQTALINICWSSEECVSDDDNAVSSL